MGTKNLIRSITSVTDLVIWAGVASRWPAVLTLAAAVPALPRKQQGTLPLLLLALPLLLLVNTIADTVISVLHSSLNGAGKFALPGPYRSRMDSGLLKTVESHSSYPSTSTPDATQVPW